MIAKPARLAGPSGKKAGGLALAGLCVCFSLSLPARADLKLCNFTESRIGVTVGYKDDTGWLTEGWWNVLSRGCVTLITGDLRGRFYYIHGIDYDRGGEWAGKTQMCIDDKTFTIRDVRNCTARGHKETGFYEVDTGDAKDYTIRLVDPIKQGEVKQ